MKATDHLAREHRAIRHVLAEAEYEAARIAWFGRISALTLRPMLEYFQSTVARCHQAKEEILLFHWLQPYERQTTRGPIGILVKEHVESRRLLGRLDRALSSPRGDSWESAQNVAQLLQAYGALIRVHMQREDDLLFPLADRLFKPEDHHALTAAFERLEQEEIAYAAQDDLHRWPGLAVEQQTVAARP